MKIIAVLHIYGDIRNTKRSLEHGLFELFLYGRDGKKNVLTGTQRILSEIRA